MDVIIPLRDKFNGLNITAIEDVRDIEVMCNCVALQRE
jgi:hypothetical protein